MLGSKVCTPSIPTLGDGTNVDSVVCVVVVAVEVVR